MKDERHQTQKKKSDTKWEEFKGKKKHKIEIYEVNKIPLSRFGDERYILNDSIHTLACFHKDLKNQFSTENRKFSKIPTKKKIFSQILISSNKWN